MKSSEKILRNPFYEETYENYLYVLSKIGISIDKIENVKFINKYGIELDVDRYIREDGEWFFLYKCKDLCFPRKELQTAIFLFNEAEKHFKVKARKIFLIIAIEQHEHELALENGIEVPDAPIYD
ncbi:MAG TPA: hypothetical protein EYP22_01605 [Methanosarcinales archaeon]|nr:hypothetical protein [Methanosarcinales archaeon]